MLNSRIDVGLYFFWGLRRCLF